MSTAWTTLFPEQTTGNDDERVPGVAIFVWNTDDTQWEKVDGNISDILAKMDTIITLLGG